MNHLNPLPTDSTVAVKVIEAQAASDKAKTDRGLIGSVFGSRENVPNNVAAIIAVAATIALFGVFAFGEDNEKLPREKIVSTLVSIITLVLGFLFGRSSKE